MLGAQRPTRDLRAPRRRLRGAALGTPPPRPLPAAWPKAPGPGCGLTLGRAAAAGGRDQPLRGTPAAWEGQRRPKSTQRGRGARSRWARSGRGSSGSALDESGPQGCLSRPNCVREPAPPPSFPSEFPTPGQPPPREDPEKFKFGAERARLGLLPAKAEAAAPPEAGWLCDLRGHRRPRAWPLRLSARQTRGRLEPGDPYRHPPPPSSLLQLGGGGQVFCSGLEICAKGNHMHEGG